MKFAEHIGVCLVLILLFAIAFRIYYEDKQNSERPKCEQAKYEARQKALYHTFAWRNYTKEDGRKILIYGRYIIRHGSVDLIELKNKRFIAVDHHGNTLYVWTCYSEVNLKDIKHPGVQHAASKWMKTEPFQEYLTKTAVKIE